MSREIIQEALNGIRDEYITEAGARLGLLAVGAAGAVGAASGAAVDPSTLYSLSGTEVAVKTGFGAWLAKGGWIALVAGVVVAAGVAAGAFFFGKGGDVPPVGTGDVTTEEQEQSRFEEDVTTEEQEESRFEGDDSEEPTEELTEEETEAPDLSYFQFPLTSADDTTSYVSITDPYGDGRKTIEFFVLPQDKKDPELISVLKFIAPQYGEANIQIVSFKTETDYGFIYVYEKVITNDPYLNPGEIHVTMEGYRLRFNQSGKYSFSPEYDSRTCYIRCKENKKVPLTQYTYNVSLLNRAEDLLANYANMEGCELTVLYRYVDGEETINQPVESMPDFPFTIFNSYNQPDVEE